MKIVIIFVLWLAFSGAVMGCTTPPTILINSGAKNSSDMNTKEIWKPVNGYDGIYEVSNLGFVRSLDRIVKSRWGTDKPLKGKLLSNSKKDWYSTFGLCKNGSRKQHSLHRLVAEAFIPNPDNKPEVNHKNGIKTDNSAVNLEWVTTAENIQHSFNNGLQVPVIRTPEMNRKISDAHKRNNHKPTKEALDNATKSRRENSPMIIELSTGVVCKAYDAGKLFGIHQRRIYEGLKLNRPFGKGQAKGLHFQQLTT